MSLDSGEVVYERNSESYFMPASNMKSFTVAAALDKLGPNFQFVTTFYATAKPDVDGALKGDLVIFGRGDPSISDGFSEGAPYSAIDQIADKLIASGIKKIEGNIVGDESYFNTFAVPYGWEWDDLQWYYGAEISALTINDNAVGLKVSPTSPGNACEVTFSPASRLFAVVNKTQTVARGAKKTLAITKQLRKNVYEISGDVPAGDGFNGVIAISEPAEVFADILKQRLELKGVTVTGRAVSANRSDHGGKQLETEGLTIIANNYSPPLSIIAGKIMKPSQNLYTELLLRALGETAHPSQADKTSEDKGKAVINELLQKAGVPADSLVQYDASGLSRHNLITPNASMTVYKYMDSSKNAEVWKNALTIGGVDGTLRRRFKNTSALANVRGKTGTIDQVSALSGYVTSKAGERFVFSILTNNIPNSGLRVSTIDEVVVLLANFEGNTSENKQTADTSGTVQ
jgi:D-alanyl-D-alanine carboxypeptidase/D-alanyl-D-alanine-endopeptidase (penicillin-binding protein 4)